MAQLSAATNLTSTKLTGRISAFQSQMHVLNALLLRDIRTRFFGHGLGYLIAIGWPVIHILILLGAYSVSGRIAPYGASSALWFATGLIPVMSFIYPSRFIMLSVLFNQPLLGLPIVKVTDIILARSILEAAGACGMTATMVLLLWLSNISVMPHDIVAAGAALAASILFGVGIGAANAVVARFAPMWATGYSLLIIVFYLTSGVLFVPDSLPDIARDVVSWNPVLHGVEWMRVAYYEGYTSHTLDKVYFIGSGFGWLAAGLGVERLIRSRLLQA